MADADNTTKPPTAPLDHHLAPHAFVQRVIDAVLPLVDGENLRDGVGRKDVYLAVVPFFAEYTIADAVSARAMISTVRDSTPYGTGDRYEAACAALDILEDFICTAFASGPECVAAQAHFATLTMGKDTNEPVAGPDNFRTLLKHICDGIGDIRSGDSFRMGERFGVPEGWTLAGSWLGRCREHDEPNTPMAESVAEGEGDEQ